MAKKKQADTVLDGDEGYKVPDLSKYIKEKEELKKRRLVDEQAKKTVKKTK